MPGVSSRHGWHRPLLSPPARRSRRPAAARRRAGLQRGVRPGRRKRKGRRGQRADPAVHRGRSAPDRAGPAPLPAGRRGRGGDARRLRVRRLRRSVAVAPAGGVGTGQGRPLQRAAARGHRRLRAGADRFGVHLRRPHPPRDPRRPVGAERTGDDPARALHAARRLHRHRPARLRGPRQLPARPLPGQRHHRRGADGRPQLGPVQRSDPVLRRARVPNRSRPA